jgi:two-component system, LytTR family, response regulator LytT
VSQKENVDILIIEDELIIAEHLNQMLQKAGFGLCRLATTYDEALQFIEERKPQLVLTDISLGEIKNGIDIGHYLRENHNIPFIYITSLHSSEIVRQASLTKPNAYLVKPIKTEDLIVSVELALAQFSPFAGDLNDTKTLVVRDGGVTIRIPTADIVVLKAEENYTAINLINQRPRMVRQFLTDLQQQLPDDQFIRIHRSYLVNINHITEIHSQHVVIRNFQLPIGRTHRHLLRDIKTSKK